jgi:DNA-binding PadR family transcriptional regulator
MKIPRSKIMGPLQTKVMILLRDQPKCGTELMVELGLCSPGTIYPVLKVLRNKGFLEFYEERSGSARKKIYRLTEEGLKELNLFLQSWTRLTCCDWSFYIKRFIDIINSKVKIQKGERVLCTLDAELTKDWLKKADVTFVSNLDDIPQNYFHKAISLIGAGTIINRYTTDSLYYLSTLKKSLKNGGVLIALEIERTDNLWAEKYFLEVTGFKEHPGLTTKELEKILHDIGMKDVEVHSGGGMLVSLSTK